MLSTHVQPIDENELVKKINTEHNSSDANNLKMAKEQWRINYNTIEKLK